MDALREAVRVDRGQAAGYWHCQLMTRIPIDTPESATPMSRALGLMVLGGLVVALVVWAAGTVWAQKLDTARFRADSISRDALDRRLLEQSELTAGRVKAMYCATIPASQQAGCN